MSKAARLQPVVGRFGARLEAIWGKKNWRSNMEKDGPPAAGLRRTVPGSLRKPVAIKLLMPG